MIVVTGGAGFIGRHLVARLHRDGERLLVVDDASTGDLSTVPAGVDVEPWDVADPRVADRIAALRPTAVVHAAAQVSVAVSVADPERDHAVNVDGTRHVVDGAIRGGARCVVFLSSGGAVYGETPGAVETDPPAPLSPYGVNKLAAEGIVRGGPGPAIARLANVYGPGQRSDQDGGVVAIFAEALADGRPITIHGDGEQIRDLVFVDDVVEALVTMLRAGRPGTWNVATGTGTSINELVRALVERYGAPVAIERGPSRPGDVRTSTLRIDRIASDLGWRPAFDLARGLDRLRTMERPGHGALDGLAPEGVPPR